MNLRLIERRFQNLDVQANYLNYKYNPNSQKVAGVSQHAYLEELRSDMESDLQVFGKDPFYTKPVDSEQLVKSRSSVMKAGQKNLPDHAVSVKSSLFGDGKTAYKTAMTVANEYDDMHGQSRPSTSKPLVPGLSSMRKVTTIEASTRRGGFRGRTAQSQHTLLRKKMNYYKSQAHYDWNLGFNATNSTLTISQTQAATDSQPPTMTDRLQASVAPALARNSSTTISPGRSSAHIVNQLTKREERLVQHRQHVLTRRKQQQSQHLQKSAYGAPSQDYSTATKEEPFETKMHAMKKQ